LATNKNAQLRYRILDRCFRNRVSPKTFEQLKDEINEVFRDLVDDHFDIPDRTLRADIKIMRDSYGYNAPIVTRKMKSGDYCYYYSDPGFSIFKTDLTDKDTEMLQSTIEMLGRYRGLPSLLGTPLRKRTERTRRLDVPVRPRLRHRKSLNLHAA
jgi:hypothetical protein